VVYASFAERGYESSVPAYYPSPTFFGGLVFGTITPEPWKASLRWGRFDGGGSTIKVIHEVAIPDFCNNSDTGTIQDQARIFAYTEPINEAGAFLVWNGNTFGDPLTMIRWSDLAVVQTTDGGHSGEDDTVPSRNGSRVFFQSGLNPNAATNNPIVAVPLDGTSTFVPFDGAPNETAHFTPNYFEAILADGIANVWGVGRFDTTGGVGPFAKGTPYAVYGYSYTCPNWRNLRATYEAGASLGRFLKVNLARIGDTLYVAASHYKPADTSFDLTPLVYEIPILRDAGTCFEILALHLDT
jgi:hypothetical protein